MMNNEPQVPENANISEESISNESGSQTPASEKKVYEEPTVVFVPGDVLDSIEWPNFHNCHLI